MSLPNPRRGDTLPVTQIRVWGLTYVFESANLISSAMPPLQGVIRSNNCLLTLYSWLSDLLSTPRFTFPLLSFSPHLHLYEKKHLRCSAGHEFRRISAAPSARS